MLTKCLLYYLTFMKKNQTVVERAEEQSESAAKRQKEIRQANFKGE